MSNNNKIPKTKRRSLPREVRRDQLINATMRSIAKHGLSGTTMAQVTKEAGLSLGIANLHFESKDKLLVETLRHVTDEYNRGQQAILDNSDHATIASRIEALLSFHFSPVVTRKNKLAVWFAFWGEAKSRPTYQRICAQSDHTAEEAIAILFQAAIEEGEYGSADASLLATGYAALVDGLWLQLLVCPRQLTREAATQVARHYLASAFPGHIKLEAAT